MASAFSNSFLKDLEDLSDDEQPIAHEEQKGGADQGGSDDKIPEISKLKNDPSYISHLETINEDLHSTQPADRFINMSVTDPIYSLIKKCNHYLTEITAEINILHKEIRDIYMDKFVELESIVYDPIEYTKCVKKIGSETDLNKVDFQGIIPNQTILSITVAASMIKSDNLSPQVLEKLFYYCDDILRLDEQRDLILRYLENRMHYIAPNVKELLGCKVTAKMIAAAGGVAELAAMPAGNVQVLGAQKKSLMGFSTQSLGLHIGFVGEVPMVAKAPQSYRKQIVRMFSTKTVLAARVDASKKSAGGEEGKKLMAQIVARFGKITEPPPPPMKRPLPKPVDKPSRKRGGRKFGNQRAKLQMTEYRKMVNTVPFGPDAQQEIGDTGIGLGMLGMHGTGKLKATSKKEQRINLMQKKQKKQPEPTRFTLQDGMVSTLALGSNEGIELVNPNARKQQTDTYFNTKSGFTTVLASKNKE